MSNYDDINMLIATYSGNERKITIPKIYLELTGDYPTAALLNQMIFWSDKTKRTDGFFYKTYEDWEEETTLSEYQVRRSSKRLKELGVLETKLKKANGSPTLHYKVNMDKLSESILNKLKNRNLTNSSNDTEDSKATLTVDDAVNDNSNTSVEVAKYPYKEVIEYLNEKTGKSISYRSNGNKKLIRARINEGYTVDDLKKVIDNKVNDWFGKGIKFSNGKPAENYLHPSTLFIPKNFDKYLNEEIPESTETKPSGNNYIEDWSEFEDMLE